MGAIKKIGRAIGRLTNSVARAAVNNKVPKSLAESAALADPDWYSRSHGINLATATEVLQHYRAKGWRMGFDPNPLFDTNWYCATYRRSVSDSRLDPLSHFIVRGWRNGCRPNPFFDPQKYAELAPAALRHPLGPLAHYLEVGARNHAAIGSHFDSRWYVEHQMNGESWPMPALAHYLRNGAYQGLAPGPEATRPGTKLATDRVRLEVQQQYTRMVSSSGQRQESDGAIYLPRGLDRGGAGRIAVYTAIFGAYDTLKLPYPEWTDHADFFCFTDQNFTETGVWRIVRPDYHSIEPSRIARFYKTHPHVYLGNYDATLWIDGNVALRAHPKLLVDEIDPNIDLMVFRHPRRRTIRSEVAECISRSKDEAALIRAQIKRYRQLGYRQKSPLIETNVIIARPSRAKVAKFFSAWWSEIDRGTRRDQLSVNFCIDSTPELVVGYQPEKAAKKSPRYLVVKHD